MYQRLVVSEVVGRRIISVISRRIFSFEETQYLGQPESLLVSIYLQAPGYTKATVVWSGMLYLPMQNREVSLLTSQTKPSKLSLFNEPNKLLH